MWTHFSLRNISGNRTRDLMIGNQTADHLANEMVLLLLLL